VGELRYLLLNGCDYCVIGVTDGDYTDARAEVGELVAVDIDQGCTVCSVNVNRQCGSNAV
jgi:tRNA A37 threonylcarbamoyladenosine dehydratase